MKNHFKKILQILAVNAVPISISSLVAASSCSSVNPTPPSPSPTKQLFEVKNNVLKGFNPDLNEQEIAELIDGNILEIPSNVSSIDHNAFYRNDASTIPSSVTHVNFNQCSNLTSIGDNAFRASNLQKLNIPVVDYIGASAFSETSVEQIIFLGTHDSSKKINIQKLAFSHNSKLEQITLCNNILNIGDEAFSENHNVIKIDCSTIDAIPDTWTGTKTFFNTGVNNCTVLEYDEYSHNALKPYFLNNGLNPTSFFAPINKYFNVTYDAVEQHSILNGFVSFRQAQELASRFNGTLYIPSFISIISKNAFWVDGHTMIPDSFTKIDLSSADALEEIGQNAFNGCDSIKSIVTPPNLPVITEDAFPNCKNLEEVHLHHNLLKIENNAFRNCSNLERIFYDGPVERCMAIEKETDWHKGTLLTTIKCTGGESEGHHECDVDLQSSPFNYFTWGEVTPENEISLKHYNYNQHLATSIFIPGYYAQYVNKKYYEYKVTKFDTEALKNCIALETVFFTNCVKSIDTNAFVTCPVLLNIKYYGSVEDWKNTERVRPWYRDILATEIYCIYSDARCSLDANALID